MYSIDYQYLRLKKAEALKAWYDEPLAVTENPAVWRGKNATILPLRRQAEDNLLFGRGGVVDENGEYVPLSGIEGRVQFAYPAEKKEYRDETVVYCGYLVNHWGHFLIEGVTRLWYFLENDPGVDKYVFFLDENEEREIRANYREFLELLGIWEHLEIINTPTTYREVIVPELGLYCRSRYTPKLLKVYDTVANNAVPDPNWERPAKIYYSRSQFKKGMPFESGFDTLDDFFRRNGYTILYPEKVPLGRMISYIRNADVVASLSGSLPHNMLFARPGQKLEIVERLTINVDNQVGINRIMDLDVTYIDAHIPIYPVDFAGPIIMGYTDCLQRFAADRGYQPPDGRFLTEKHYRKCFIKYMKAYEDLYNYNWFMFDWYAPLTESLIEGFRAGQTYFGDYLNRRKPFRWYHYLEFHYWKQFIKRLIKR